MLTRSLEETARGLGADGARYAELMRPLIDNAVTFFPEILRPIRLPSHPFLMTRFGLAALRSCTALTRSLFRDGRTRARCDDC